MIEAAGVKEGDILAGRYRVERVLGSGGMGVVVAAVHVALDQRVALKFMHDAGLDNPQLVGRFLREGRALARLKSDHVARVTDVGTLPSGAPYLVMEFLDGSDLEAIVKGNGPLPTEVAVDYVLQALEGIAEAHAAGIVHRDLKPANFFLTRSVDGKPLVKVLDFGISKDTSEDLANVALTHTTAVLGSPQYMSPEQLKSSRDVDARTDVWSLGVSLYALLTAKVPFDAATFVELSSLVLTAPPGPLREHRPDVPQPLVDVVGRCLAKKADERFADVAELAAALEPFASPASRGAAARVHTVLRTGGARRVSIIPEAGAVGLAGVSDATIASGPSLPSSASMVKPTAPSGPDTGPLVLTLAEGEARAGRRARVAIVVGVVGALLGGVALLLRPSPPAASAAPPASPAPSSTVAATAVAPPVAPKPPPPANDVAPPSTGAPPGASATPPPRPTPPAHAAHPAPRKHAASPSPDDLLQDRN